MRLGVAPRQRRVGAPELARGQPGHSVLKEKKGGAMVKKPVRLSLPDLLSQTLFPDLLSLYCSASLMKKTFSQTSLPRDCK